MPALESVVETELEYPDSDGEPIAENTLQFDVLSTFKWNVQYYFEDRSDVFVAGDLLIYPVLGSPKIRQAPDIFVAFGRPPGYRGSYKLWKEANIFPQVIVEVWSPGNSGQLETRKKAFYQKYGAEEYYIIYPSFPIVVKAYLRQGTTLRPIEAMEDFVSPRLGVRFSYGAEELKFFGPDGREFSRPDAVVKQRNSAESRADALAAKLRSLGVDPDTV